MKLSTLFNELGLSGVLRSYKTGESIHFTFERKQTTEQLFSVAMGGKVFDVLLSLEPVENAGEDENDMRLVLRRVGEVPAVSSPSLSPAPTEPMVEAPSEAAPPITPATSEASSRTDQTVTETDTFASQSASAMSAGQVTSTTTVTDPAVETFQNESASAFASDVPKLPHELAENRQPPQAPKGSQRGGQAGNRGGR